MHYKGCAGNMGIVFIGNNAAGKFAAHGFAVKFRSCGRSLAAVMQNYHIAFGSTVAAGHIIFNFVGFNIKTAALSRKCRHI